MTAFCSSSNVRKGVDRCAFEKFFLTEIHEEQRTLNLLQNRVLQNVHKNVVFVRPVEYRIQGYPELVSQAREERRHLAVLETELVLSGSGDADAEISELRGREANGRTLSRPGGRSE